MRGIVSTFLFFALSGAAAAATLPQKLFVRCDFDQGKGELQARVSGSAMLKEQGEDDYDAAARLRVTLRSGELEVFKRNLLLQGGLNTEGNQKVLYLGGEVDGEAMHLTINFRDAREGEESRIEFKGKTFYMSCAR